MHLPPVKRAVRRMKAGLVTWQAPQTGLIKATRTEPMSARLIRVLQPLSCKGEKSFSKVFRDVISGKLRGPLSFRAWVTPPRRRAKRPV